MIPKFLLPLSLLLALVASSGCSTIGQPREIDPATGRIKTQSIYGETKATVVKNEKLDLAKFKPLALALGGTFVKEQTVKLGYFASVVDRQDMERLLIKEGKSGLVTDVTNLLSWKKIADEYKPFVVLKPDTRAEGRKTYMQLKVIRADTADEVFVAEVKLDFMWKGVNDDTVFYPLFNALIAWLDQNK